MTTPSRKTRRRSRPRTIPAGPVRWIPVPAMRCVTTRAAACWPAKRALITGGDSGIGRAVAVAFAKEGADVAIAYLSEQEDEDAQHTAGAGQEGRAPLRDLPR